MTWWADYNLTLSEVHGQCQIDLNTWVTLINQSGASYQQAQLKLIAGDVQRISQGQQPRMYAREQLKATSQFEEQSLFEYHMYRLNRTINLPNNASKQIQLIPTRHGINCEKILTYNGSQQTQWQYHSPITDPGHLNQSHSKVNVSLRVDNTEDNQLGIPLPAGRVRVNTEDNQDGSLEFIGEDRIDHTPRNQPIHIRLGSSFDVTGARKQTLFERQKHGATERYLITLSNQKGHDQVVRVIEPLYRWSNWQITQHNHEYTRLNASHIQFEVNVRAGSEVKIEYTANYQWPD